MSVRGYLTRSRILMRLLVVIGLVLPAFLGPAGTEAELGRQESGEPVVEVSTPQELRFSLALPEASWREELPDAAGQIRWEVAVGGFVTGGLPAQARLPRRGGMIVVPAGTRPVLEVVSETWRDLEPRLLAIQPVPVLQGDPQSDEVFAGEFTPGPGKSLPLERVPETVRQDLALRAQGLVGAPAVVLDRPDWWRGRRVATYTVIPVQVDADGRAVRALTAGTWRVRFERDDAAGKAALPVDARKRLVGKGDERFASMFLNGETLSTWPTEAAARGGKAAGAAAPEWLEAHRGGKSATPLFPEVRIPVTKTQLYRVRASQMRTAGLLPADVVQESQIRLYQRRYLSDLDDPANDLAAPYVEVEVPIAMFGENDAFDGDDYFVFWGLRPRDDGAFSLDLDGHTVQLADGGDLKELNNDFNVYWLQVADPQGGATWARMEQFSLPAAQGTPLASYHREDYLEEAYGYREFVPNLNEDRVRYNGELATSLNVALPLWSPVPGQTGTIALGVAARILPPYSVIVNLALVGAQKSSYPLPSATMYNLPEIQYNATIPAAALAEPSLYLNLREPSGLRMFASLGWIRMAYDATFAAVNGRLQFPAGEPLAVNDLEVTGFASTDVTLFEITAARTPVLIGLNRDNVVSHDTGYLVSLRVDQSGGRREFYAVNDLANQNIDIEYFSATLVENPVIPTQLAGDRADALVVIHPKFRQAAQRWIDHRLARAASEGLAMQVVAPQDIYDWYSGGLKNPWAIKRFVDHALDSPTWGPWALVLIGDANENVRQLGATDEPYASYSRDYIPTHHHIQQAASYLPEVLASDKWYVCKAASRPTFEFPDSVRGPWDLLVGRLPCNSDEQLNHMIDKIIQTETAPASETWRQHALFFADDEYSFGSYNEGGSGLIYQPEERGFRWSERDSCAVYWRNNGGMVPLQADTLMLRTYMSDLYGSDPYLLGDAIAHCRAVANPPLIAALNQGGLLAHYQGHGNAVVMTHESWFKDDRRNNLYTDVDLLTNVDKPWMYFGMGCHIADWAQYTLDQSGTPKNSLCEKFVGWTAAGAYAAYGSSGYEYLGPNKEFSEWQLNRMMIRPPQSRWLLGELVWAWEGDARASNPGSPTYRAMVSQYTLLGDPLMYLDCGLPIVEATLDGEPISGEVNLVAVDATNLREVHFVARDEAGIGAVQLIDSEGVDLTSPETVIQVSEVRPNRQIVEYRVVLPVRPFDHRLFLHVRDTADRLPTDEHVTLTFNVEQNANFTAPGPDGEPIEVDPNTYVFTPGQPVRVSAVMTVPAFITSESEIHVTGEGLLISDVNVTVGKSTEVSLAFTADAINNTPPPRYAVVSIDGYQTRYLLEAGEGTAGGVSVRELVNYPNPMRDETRFLFRTNLGGGQGRLQIYTVSGRLVSTVEFAVPTTTDVIVPWDGRDREGDRLANGVYFYRVQVDGAAGSGRSDMQRLVVMR